MTDIHSTKRERERIAAEKRRREKGISPVKNTEIDCIDCKNKFIRKVIHSVRCKQCQKKFVLEKAREVSRQKCANARKIGSKDQCANCSKEFTVNNPREKYCPDCKILQKKSALPQMKLHSKKYKQKYMQCKENRRKSLDMANALKRYKRANDPIFSLIDRCRARLNQAFRLNGYTKRSKTHEIIGCSWDFLMGYIDSQFQPGMTWENRSEWHIDHRIPLATAKTEEDVIRLNHYTNLQPLWAADNLRKSDKLDFQL